MLTEHRSSLAVRVTAICLVVAGVMAIVAGLISTRLVVSTATGLTRQTMSDQADVIAGQVTEGRLAINRVTGILQGQGISVVLRRVNGAIVSGDATATQA